MDSKISHGRGGAANINPDDQPYTDGSIVREGEPGDQGNGAFSAGRGGTGNIGTPNLKPTNGGQPGDSDVVPETAMRAEYDHYHTGRGGEGNVHKDAEEAKKAVAASRDASTTRSQADAPAAAAIDAKKVDKEKKKAEWREKNPPPGHDGLGDKGVYWVKKKIFG